MESGYKKYVFGNSIKLLTIEAKNVEYAIKKFKVQELWPEIYVADEYLEKGSWIPNDADVYIPLHIKEDAKIFVYLKDENSERYILKTKPICNISLAECINYDYVLTDEGKYLPLAEQDDKTLAMNSELQNAFMNKIKSREYMIQMGKMKKELESKLNDIKNEVQKFQSVIVEKMKHLFAIETYLGTYEDVFQLLEGKKASNDEKITVYQQKCFMDEEVGLTEIEGYEQGIDYNDVEQFDKWIVKHYKRYLYKEKGIMAWQICRKNKEYGDFLENMVANEENMRTYFLIRNGENLYRIYSGVRTPDSMFPTKKEMEKMYNESLESEFRKKRFKNYIEKYLYILIALQGLIDRTDILGTELCGKIDIINQSTINNPYIELIRDNENEYLLNDGRLSWKEYLTNNQNTICEGMRVLVNRQIYNFNVYGENEDDSPEKDLNGSVFIAEGVKYHDKRVWAEMVLDLWDKMIEFIKSHDGQIVDDILENEFYESFNYNVTLDIINFVNDSLSKTLQRIKIAVHGGDIFLANNHKNELTLKDNRLVAFEIIKRMEEVLPEIKESSVRIRYNDMFKIMYHTDDTVYSGWSDYEGHERKNRKTYWARRDELINIDEVEIEDIRYYLNNRLYRKEYLSIMTFLKRVYKYKIAETKVEKPFIELLSNKSGVEDIKKIKGLMKWWKIKNKWRRFLQTDEDKAYRMIMERLKGEKSK